MGDSGFLDVDSLETSGQKFALISIVSKTSNQKTDNDKIGLKIRGCFATRDEANAHAVKLHKIDPTFDIFCVDMYSWLLCPPDTDKIGDEHYSEKYLNDMVKGYKETQLDAKQHFAERKANILRDGLDAHLEPHEKLPQPEGEDIHGVFGDTPGTSGTT